MNKVLKLAEEVNNYYASKKLQELINTSENLQKQIEELKHEINKNKSEESESSCRLSNLIVGDKFMLMDQKWKILDITDEGFFCLSDGMDFEKFEESSNNWRYCVLRNKLDKFSESIMSKIGEDNVLGLHRDLTSLDGRTDYGVCFDYVSLLTFDEYRKYRSLIDVDEKFHLITPFSTSDNGYDRTICYVDYNETVYSGIYDNTYLCRPVIYLNPNTIVKLIY